MSMTFDWGGTSRVMSDEAMDGAIFDRTLPFTDTFGLSTTSGFLKGGLGTFTREAELPPGAPTQRGLGIAQDEPAPGVGYAQERAGVAGTNDQNFAPQFETEQQFQGRREEAGAIDEATYKAAPYFRPDIPYSPEMTEPRARAQAEIRDRQKAREFFQQKRPITSFFGELTGGLPQPENFIPVFGPAVRAAAVARVGRTAGTAAVMSGEAAVSQAVFGAASADARQQFGDDVTWQAQITDIAMGALTGGLIGGLVGKVGGRFDTIKNHSKARAALDNAASELAESGEVRLNPTTAEFVNGSRAGLRPLQNFDDFMTLVRDRDAQFDIGRSAENAADLRTGTTAPPVVTRATFTPLADLNIRDPEALAREINPEAFQAFDELTQQQRALRGRVAEMSQARGAEAETLRGELGRVDAEFNRTPPDQWPALEARQTALRERISQVQGKGDTPEIARVREHIQLLDHELRDLGPKIGQALEQGKQRWRESGLPPDTMRILRDFDMQGGIRFRDRPDAIDFSSPVQAPDTVRVQQAARAEASIGKPETTQSFAKDVGFDPETGESAISAIAKQIEAEGRLTPEDASALKAADEGIQDASAWAETLRVATGCVL